MTTMRFPSSRLLAICFVGIGLIIALLPLHAFISTWGGTSIGPLLLWKSWKEILLVSLLFVFLAWLIKSRQIKPFLKDHLVAAIALYAFLSLVSAIFHMEQNGIEATAAGLVMNLRYPLIALLAYGVFRFGDIDYQVWRRSAAYFLVIAGTILAVIGILQVTIIPSDFLSQFGYDKNTSIAPYVLIDENPDALRAFATLRGPNDFGAFLIVPLLLALMVVRKNKWMWAPVILISSGIFASGSRSAWVGALIAVLGLIVFTIGKKALSSKKLLVGIATGLIAISLLFYAALFIPSVRLAVFHSSPGDNSLTEGSTDQHWEATASGVQRALNEPFGCGPGCAGPASYYGDNPQISENYYVQILEETGVGGFTLWLAIAGIVGYRLYRSREDWMARILIASGIGISIIGLWLHVWSDDPLSLTWWALAGMTLGYAASKSAKKLVS